MNAGPPGRAAIYTRQSHGKERSIAEQETAGRDRCAGEGWPVEEVYTDKTSASRFATKGRPDWERLLRDLESGRFGILWMWESSRGDRDAETWLGLLRRCRIHGVRIYVETHERLYDVANHRDWRTLADEGVDSHYESEKTSGRIKRDLRANAVNGRPHGITLYGYERIYDTKTRDLIEQREHPVYGAIVREVFSLADRGFPISAIADDLNERGVPPPKVARNPEAAGEWTRATVRQLLTNPGYIGRRRSGSSKESRRFTQTYDAAWPPIVDEPTYWRVQRRLSDPARKLTRPGRVKWLLSYVARCGECGGHLCAHRDGTLYGCSDHGCIYIGRLALDGYAVGQVMAWWKEADKTGEISARAAGLGDVEVLRARSEAGELRARLDEMALMSARGEISPRALAIAEAELTPKITAAEKRAQRAALPPALASLGTPDAGFREAWDAIPLAEQREVIRTLMVIKVHRATRHGPGTVFDPERVAITWRDAA